MSFSLSPGGLAGRRTGGLLLVAALLAVFSAPAQAGLVGYYAAGNFSLTNTAADGSFTTDGFSMLTITGGNTGSGLAGTTDLTILAASAGIVSFSYSYTTLDPFPDANYAGYLLGNTFTAWDVINNPQAQVSFAVAAGQSFGFRVGTIDNTLEPGVLTITNFNAPLASSVPEPGSLGVAGLALIALAAAMRRFASTRRFASVRRGLGCAAVLAAAITTASAQQNTYHGTVITGQLAKTATVNLSTTASAMRVTAFGANGPEVKPNSTRFLRPPFTQRLNAQGITPMASMPITRSAAAGFDGITHYLMRTANSGNQFSIEPANPSIAANNQYVLEGVNNAVQVYNIAGTPLLSKVLTTNQVFGLGPAIDRSTGINGVYGTDTKVFYDQSIDRWFVLQRSQDNDIYGNNLNSSHLYLAMSQTGDPTANWSVYTMDTTNLGHFGCPCFTDYPQIGADQNAIYISTNQYNTAFQNFVDARIFMISKASLAANSTTPKLMQFTIPRVSGYEFTIFPATTPPGASYYIAQGGIEYFVSTQSLFSADNQVGLWAMVNTASIDTTPNVVLYQTQVQILPYTYPDIATQKPGPMPYGLSLSPAGLLEYVDGGDSRVQSVVYSGGRLYVTFQAKVQDENGRYLVGGAYAIISSGFRLGSVIGLVYRQGYLMVSNNHLLRPAIGVTAQGKGAIVATLIGPDYYPSPVVIPFTLASTGPSVQIAADGAGPEDGFSGYPDIGFTQQGTARWGDSSSAVVAPDGSVWLATEYIPGGARTLLANWGTYLVRYRP